MSEDQALVKPRLPKRVRPGFGEPETSLEKRVTIPRSVPRLQPGELPEGRPIRFGLFDPDD